MAECHSICIFGVALHFRKCRGEWIYAWCMSSNLSQYSMACMPALISGTFVSDTTILKLVCMYTSWQHTCYMKNIPRIKKFVAKDTFGLLSMFYICNTHSKWTSVLFGVICLWAFVCVYLCASHRLLWLVSANPKTTRCCYVALEVYSVSSIWKHRMSRYNFEYLMRKPYWVG